MNLQACVRKNASKISPFHNKPILAKKQVSSKS